MVSAKTTPFPCVPSNNFTIKGEPPTILIKLSVSKGELAKPVVGISIPLFKSNCNEYNLSRDWVMAVAEFKTKTFKASN
ncbi:hypothetical protein D3C85_1634700 [compost metagenome]